MNRVQTVVLAWNHWDDTQECLESLLKTEGTPVRIVVVDNGSSDGTSDRIRANYPDIVLVCLPTNVGVNAGYNFGMEQALADGAEFIVTMNNDTWAHPRLLPELSSALEADPRVAVATPKIVYYDDPRRLWSAGARWRAFPPGVKVIGLNKMAGPSFDRLREVDFATSCCLCLRASALREVGLFDPSYRFYYGDWDFALRVRASGRKVVYVPGALLRHKVSAATKKADPSGRWTTIEGQDSVRFYLRNFGRTALATMTAWVVLRSLATGSSRSILPYLRGVQQGLTEHRHESACSHPGL